MKSADPGRRKGERAREERCLKNSNNNNNKKKKKKKNNNNNNNNNVFCRALSNKLRFPV